MKTLVSYFFIFTLSILFGCQSNTKEKTIKTPSPDRETLAKSSCSTCGMDIAAFVEWGAKMEIQNQVGGKTETLFFCSPRCLITTHLNPKKKFIEQKAWFTDFYEQDWIEDSQVIFVYRSRLMGPMGPDFIPHATKEAAEAFKKENGGKGVFKYEEITQETLKSISL